MLFIEMLRRAKTDLFCFGAKSRGVCLFIESSTDIITIAPRRLFPLLLGTYLLHTIHHEKIYIQCYNCNNLIVHKGHDQVNIVEVYLLVISERRPDFHMLRLESFCFTSRHKQ